MHDSLRDWQRVSPLLDELLELDAASGAKRLAALPTSDATLAAAVEEMLAQALDGEHFAEGSALASEEPSLAGRTLGAYTIDHPETRAAAELLAQR